MTPAGATGRTCDTSVLVPALVAWHEDHEECRAALHGVGHVPAHVLAECFSVLTRLPAPHRIAPAAAAALVSAVPFTPVALPAADVPTLLARIGGAGIRGGATYDALVGASAAHAGLTLLTRDRRAAATYRVVGVDHLLV